MQWKTPVPISIVATVAKNLSNQSVEFLTLLQPTVSLAPDKDSGKAWTFLSLLVEGLDGALHPVAANIFFFNAPVTKAKGQASATLAVNKDNLNTVSKAAKSMVVDHLVDAWIVGRKLHAFVEVDKGVAFPLEIQLTATEVA